jgi:Flp pilus assembly pilin Flp
MFAYAINAVRAISTDKKGAALVEYGLLVGLIACAAAAAILALGGKITGLFGVITGLIPAGG